MFQVSRFNFQLYAILGDVNILLSTALILPVRVLL